MLKKMILLVLLSVVLTGCVKTLSDSPVSEVGVVTYDLPKIYSTLDVDFIGPSAVNITCWDWVDERINLTGEWSQRITIADATYIPYKSDVMQTLDAGKGVTEYRRTYYPSSNIQVNYRKDFKEINQTNRFEMDCKYSNDWEYKYIYTDSTGYEKNGSFFCDLSYITIVCERASYWMCDLYDRHDNDQVREYDLSNLLLKCIQDKMDHIGARR
jgi:hypothetical protein